MWATNRARLLSTLAPICFAIGGAAGAQAQDHDGHSMAGAPADGPAAVQDGLWSDSATWSGGAVPAEGDAVTIGEGMDVVLDVDTPALHGLNVDGTLSFSDANDVELTTEWVLLRGALQAGSEAAPHTRNATITLTDAVPDENINGMGDRGILVVGGTLSLHGDRENSWTKLAETAEAGSTSIAVLDASGWRVGDEIVLASTDFNPRQAETRRIAGVSGNTLTLDAPLEYMHFGQVTYDVDERGEVGLLTRNIKVQASPDAEETYFGGHIMAMDGSEMTVSGVELTRMGQHLTLARYPIHWHINGDVAGQYIKNSAIHDTYNRCVTVHGTDNLRVENNVTYNTVGHCFFMEDAIESGNQFVRNLGIQTKCHPTLPCISTRLAAAGEDPDYEDRYEVRANGQASKDVLIPSDNTVATFWITNPDNIYVDNVAAGSDSTGFWMSLPEHPTGAFEGTEISQAVWPRRTAFREFRGNVAHSNYDGFMFDRNVNPDGTFGVTGNAHMPKEDPEDENSRTVETVFENLTAYMNRNGGIWGRGEMHIFRNVKLADNAMGYTHASGAFGSDPYTSLVVDSLFVGETDNVGNPTTPEEIAYGRSLPKPEMPDFPIRGYEYYDYRHDVENTTFVNYEDNATRKTGALSYLMYTSAGVSTENAIEGTTFIDAKPVYYPPMEYKWGNDHLGGVAWKTAVFHDKDGSVGGVPDSYILINDGVYDSVAADAEACEVKPDWNAAVCTGDVGRLIIGAAASRAAAPAAGAGTSGRSSLGAVGGRPRVEEPPVVLSRNGKDFPVTRNQSTIRGGTEVTLTTDRADASLSLREMDEGSWVIFELPGFSSAAAGAETSSLEALRAASDTAYYKDDDALWVKLVAAETDAGPFGFRGGASIDVSR